jgi:hypothetical protein
MILPALTKERSKRVVLFGPRSALVVSLLNDSLNRVVQYSLFGWNQVHTVSQVDGYLLGSSQLLFIVIASHGNGTAVQLVEINPTIDAASLQCSVYGSSTDNSFGATMAVMSTSRGISGTEMLVAVNLQNSESIAIVKFTFSSQAEAFCSSVATVRPAAPYQFSATNTSRIAATSRPTLVYGIGASLAFSPAGGGMLLAGAPFGPTWPKSGSSMATGKMWQHSGASQDTRKCMIEYRFFHTSANFVRKAGVAMAVETQLVLLVPGRFVWVKKRFNFRGVGAAYHLLWGESIKSMYEQRALLASSQLQLRASSKLTGPPLYWAM